jgi:hypothetical protein
VAESSRVLGELEIQCQFVEFDILSLGLGCSFLTPPPSAAVTSTTAKPLP